MGPDPVTGKRRQRTKSGFKTKREAEEAVRVVLDEVRTGAYVQPSTETLGEYLAGWLERVKPGDSRFGSVASPLDRMVTDDPPWAG